LKKVKLKDVEKNIEALEKEMLELTNTGTMTVKEFCHITGVSFSWFYTWRKGKKCTHDQIMRMAKKLEL
jgi:predicted transcriptional regulator